MPRKIALAIAAAATLIAAAPAHAEPVITTMPGPTSQPFDVAVASDGRPWFSDKDSRLVRVEADGSVTPFTGGFAPFQRAHRIALGPDGNLWSTLNTDPGFTPSAILRTTPAGESTAFSVPRAVGDITAGPDGNVWFTTSNGRLAYMTPAGDRTDLPSTGFLFSAITAGSDGNLWVGTFDGTSIQRVTPAGVFTDFDDPSFVDMRITGMTLGPDGAVWFSMTDTRSSGRGPGRIGRITPSGEIATFQNGIAGDLGDIAAGRDGNLWVTERAWSDGGGGRILRMTPAGEVTPFSDGLGGGTPGRIVAHPDGSLWFTLEDTNRIGRIGEPSVAGGPGPSDPGPVDPGPGPVDPATDAAPTSRITAPGARVRQAKRKAVAVKGTATDDKGVARVHVSIVRRAGKRCESLTSAGRWKRYAATKRKCSPRFTLTAKGKSSWALALRRKLPKGAYTVASRATDGAGQTEKKPVGKSVRVLR